MSSVTDMFVIIGDSDLGSAELIAPQVARAITEFENSQFEDDASPGRLDRLPVLSLERDDWSDLQGGSKVAGSAVLWFGWNYAQPGKLIDCLKAKGFKHITVWSHHEFTDEAPTVVSW